MRHPPQYLADSCVRRRQSAKTRSRGGVTAGPWVTEGALSASTISRVVEQVSLSLPLDSSAFPQNAKPLQHMRADSRDRIHRTNVSTTPGYRPTVRRTNRRLARIARPPSSNPGSAGASCRRFGVKGGSAASGPPGMMAFILSNSWPIGACGRERVDYRPG